MAERTLIARVHADAEQDGTLLVTSPVVGLADGAPRLNVFLNPLDRIVEVKILGQRHVLRLPRAHQGRVTEVFIPNALTALAYDQPLARLDPRAAEAEPASGGSAAGAGEDGGDAAGDLITITAPSEGIFYRRPKPEAPAYVEVGAEVSDGAVLGLVEVMKCFNQITYGGADLPAKGKIVKILADDAAELTFGQPLFLLAPLA